MRICFACEPNYVCADDVCADVVCTTPLPAVGRTYPSSWTSRPRAASPPSGARSQGRSGPRPRGECPLTFGWRTTHGRAFPGTAHTRACAGRGDGRHRGEGVQLARSVGASAFGTDAAARDAHGCVTSWARSLSATVVARRANSAALAAPGRSGCRPTSRQATWRMSWLSVLATVARVVRYAVAHPRRAPRRFASRTPRRPFAGARGARPRSRWRLVPAPGLAIDIDTPGDLVLAAARGFCRAL